MSFIREFNVISLIYERKKKETLLTGTLKIDSPNPIQRDHLQIHFKHRYIIFICILDDKEKNNMIF